MASLQRILHVDDEPDIQEIARMTLELVGGFTVHTCASGYDALEKAPEFKPDLILLDVMMPGMDGPTTYNEFLKNPVTAEIPVIFMTAKVQPQEIEQYLQMGAVGVIVKPFDPALLSEEISVIWAKSQ
jgi:CheY-like chemotaxis protein